MSLDSPAEVIPFTRFLEHRERLHRIAAAKRTIEIPAPTELSIEPETTHGADADHGESPRSIGNRLVDA